MVEVRIEKKYRPSNKPQLSIVVLTWNGVNYLRSTLPKVFETSQVNTEVIIFDNGSIDGTEEYIKELINSINNPNINRIVYVISDQNLGISKGKNQAIKYSLGKYLLILDNDILINKNTEISRFINHYEEFKKTHTNIGFVNIPLYDKEIPDKTRQYGVYYGLYGIVRNPFTNIKSILSYTDVFVRQASCFGGNLFIEREIWNILGGFDESQLFNIDDDDIGSRATVLGYRNYVYTKCFFEHIGLANRKNNKQYTWYFTMYYSGKMRPIWKNFSIFTALWMSFCFSAVTIGVALKQSILRLYPQIFFAFIKSFFIFLSRFPDTLKERKFIQEKRAIKDSELLSIKSPKYDRISTLDLKS